MKRSVLVLCVFISVAHAFWKEIKNIVPDSINPVNLLYTNRCIEDLGCFYTGPPFHHPLNRPISLPPTSRPEVYFHLFTADNPEDPYELLPTEESLRNSSFNRRKETKIVIHGFMADLDFNAIRFEIKSALVYEGGYNVIVVDWSSNNGPPYAQAVANTRVVGALTAKLITVLIDKGRISPQSIHIIGHSLGAHTAGYAGERITNIGRITGLDPAGPYFQDAEAEVRLDTTDALYVDVIHTDGAEFVLAGLGISQAIGHVDFYPNGGSKQPGCAHTNSSIPIVSTAINLSTQFVTNACDHSRCHDLFLHSINSTSCAFMGVQCESYANFEKGMCPPSNSTVAEMGFHNKPIPGLAPPAKFFLRTTGDVPFCIQDSIYL